MAAEDYRNLIEHPSDRVIVALDNMDWTRAGDVMDEVGSFVGMGKANSLALDYGWIRAVDQLDGWGVRTMADPKLNDIPKTVELGAQAITAAGATLITVHISAGVEALKAAVAGREAALDARPDLRREHLGGILGITVLTSLKDEACVAVFGDEPYIVVKDFAKMAVDAGVDGIVCSPREVAAIRANPETADLLLVVPGITPQWANQAPDQSRVGTPHQAILDGADFIVVGRAITQPPQGMSRGEAAERIADEIAATGVN